jgi:hypothetical protein
MSIWIAIHPNKVETRVLATAQGQQTLLKAKLSVSAKHPRALPSLLEAIALWEGQKVHAALVADEKANTCGTNLFTDCFAVVEPTPLYHLAIVGGITPRRRHDTIRGLGQFSDLYRLLVEEVAR